MLADVAYISFFAASTLLESCFFFVLPNRPSIAQSTSRVINRQLWSTRPLVDALVLPRFNLELRLSNDWVLLHSLVANRALHHDDIHVLAFRYSTCSLQSSLVSLKQWDGGRLQLPSYQGYVGRYSHTLFLSLLFFPGPSFLSPSIVLLPHRAAVPLSSSFLSALVTGAPPGAPSPRHDLYSHVHRLLMHPGLSRSESPWVLGREPLCRTSTESGLVSVKLDGSLDSSHARVNSAKVDSRPDFVVLRLPRLIPSISMRLRGGERL